MRWDNWDQHLNKLWETRDTLAHQMIRPAQVTDIYVPAQPASYRITSNSEARLKSALEEIELITVAINALVSKERSCLPGSPERLPGRSASHFFHADLWLIYLCFRAKA
jgi:hypothetical protein